MQTILAQTGDPASFQSGNGGNGDGKPGDGKPGDGKSRPGRHVGPLDDVAWNAPVKRLTRAEAADLRRRQPALSPWAVVGAQALLGLALAGLAWLAFDAAVAASALYGAAVAVLPGALMARAATSRLPTLAPALSAFSMLLWALVKIGASVILLALAPRLIQPLSWPALLAALVLCLQVYWFALLWRGRKRP
jgi:ATP synthase protein I